MAVEIFDRLLRFIILPSLVFFLIRVPLVKMVKDVISMYKELFPKEKKQKKVKTHSDRVTFSGANSGKVIIINQGN